MDYDPLRFELSEALGAVVMGHRLVVEQLRTKAMRQQRCAEAGGG
jgi:hypothetical protein